MHHIAKGHEMIVNQFMTRKVFTIRADKKLIVVKDIMDWAHIRHVPVIDEYGKLVGVISHRDLLSASLAMIDKANTEFDRKNWLAHIQVKDVMQNSVLTVQPSAPISQVARLMRTRKIGCIPVVEAGKLVGIITEHDLLQIVEAMSSNPADPSDSDDMPT